MKSINNLSLRGLAIFIALVCIWLAMTVNLACRQAKSVARIEAMRGHVLYDYEVEVVRNQVLADGSTTDLDLVRRTDPQSSWPQWLIRAAGRDLFHNVEMADVWSDQPEVDTRAIVNSLPALKELDLHGYAATPGAVEAASRLPRLEMLFINGQATRLGEDSLVGLAGSRKLRGLAIKHVSLSERDLESLRQLSNLEYFSCEGCRLNSQPLEPVMVTNHDKIQAFLQNPLSP